MRPLATASLKAYSSTGEHLSALQRTALGILGLTVVVLATGTLHSQGAAPVDAAARLQQQIDDGVIKLAVQDGPGYLRSLLDVLDVPESSQGLVFSRTSLMNEYISPRTPRAVYFNDAVYVASAVGGPSIEIALFDPQKGAVFYTLDHTQNQGRQSTLRRFV